MNAEPMTTREYEAGRTTVLELHGSLVAATILQLEPLIARFLLRHQPLVIDLAGVSKADSTGAMLLHVAARAARASSPVRIAAPNAAVCATLRACGVLADVACFHSVDGAVRDDAIDRIVDRPPTS